MDNGEVIPNLDKPWEFLMARLHEWLSGMIFALIVNEVLFTNTANAMPFIVSIMILSTYGMACARIKFADGTRGCVNWCSTKMGIPPRDIPTPAELQPIWSGAPLRRLKSDTLFMILGFDEFFLERKKEELQREQDENYEEGF